MKTKKGKHTCNARVDVDYSSGKPKIKFDYPGKNPSKDAIKQGAPSHLMFLIWIIIGVIPFFIFLFGMTSNVGYPSQCNNFTVDSINYNKTVNYTGYININYTIQIKKVMGFNITCDNKTIIYQYSDKRNFGIDPIFYQKGNIKDELLILLPVFWLFLSIFLSTLITRKITKRLVKKKWYQKWLPKANAEGVIFKKRNKKYYKYKPKDMTGNVIVIPRFNNVELDYITSGDFGSKLKSIIIREYKQRNINTKTKKKSKEKVEHFKWYAVFEFTEKPKKGFLEVIYQ